MPELAPRLRKKVAGETRKRLLEAAEHLGRTVGPAGMSLDAVAAAAGVSKGGLLYHFPSKHALLRALVQDHVAGFRLEMDRLCPGWAEPADDRQALLGARAYVAAMRELMQQTDSPSSGVFAALTEDPHFMAPLLELRGVVRRMFSRCPPEAMLVLGTCEGVVHDRMIDPDHWDCGWAETQFRLMERLLEELVAGRARFAG
ncbi:TetR/AcrR family transcriptional regulator [Cereibacter azotoformans]|uniref:TetR/AcrR family transcriptional regulator n=1 Tax=Cereibacter azotoformans TaxID=43057 RepID=UPI002E270480